MNQQREQREVLKARMQKEITVSPVMNVGPNIKLAPVIYIVLNGERRLGFVDI